MNIMTVVGARPQFIKASTVSRELDAEYNECLVHTGQHYDSELSAVFFKELELPTPAHHLGVGSAPHAQQTADMISSLGPIVDEDQPEVMLVYGDTNSTLAAAIVASKTPTKLVHVEAGLRSGNRAMPEEVNRIVTDHLSIRCCAPTRGAMDNLEAEGLGDRSVLTGDVMYDALRWARTQREPASVASIRETVDGAYQLVTIHRPRNTDDHDRLVRIIDGILESGENTVFPAHPRVIEALGQTGRLEDVKEDMTVIDPVSYLSFVHLLDGATRVITDSGGVQKEAYLLETPCLTLRAETEWPETTTDGWNRLVDADPVAIREAIESPAPRTKEHHPFGDGNAAAAVIETIEALIDDQPAVW